MFCSRCGTEVQTQAKFCPSCGLDLSSTTPLAAVQAQTPAERTELEAVREALKDEWDLQKELGRGGMAIVYKARDKQLDREVAIKVLPSSLSFDAEFVERFEREARTAAKLEHPHIIPIYRVGKSGRVIYFVMKFLRGASLSDRLEQRSTLPPAEIRQLLVEAARALGYAHKHGIVHRDIKPDNMMYDEAGHVVIMDFGIAKAATGTRLTGTGMSIGTPHYMSPEQARAQKLDGRSDIYSLGVVAYQCLTGHVPFDGEDAFSIGYKHIMEDLPVPELQLPEQRRLYEVIRHMMAKAPEERFQSADELVAALEGGAPPRAAPTAAVSYSEAATAIIPTPVGGRPSIAATARPATPTTPLPKAEPKPEPKKKRRGGVVVGFLLFFFFGGGGAAGYWYFGMGAPWPLPFLAGGEQPTPPGQPVVTPPDAMTVAANDTAAGDTAQARDTTTTAPAPRDTARPAPLPATGTLVLNGVTSMMSATVDGNATRGGSLQLAPGAHRIVVRQTGFEPFERTVQIARGAADTVTISLRAIPPPATPQCDDPAGEHFNLNGACFDTPPSLRVAPAIPMPAGLTERPAPVRIWVKVTPDGGVDGYRWETQGSVPQFAREALRFVREAAYNPAQKSGQPAAGWLLVTVQARPR